MTQASDSSKWATPRSLILTTSLAALILVAGLAALIRPASVQPAVSGFTITNATIAEGDLRVDGQVDEPNTAILLDDGYTENTDRSGRFQFRIAYHPATCTVVLKSERQSRAVVIANCGQRGPAGPPGAAGPAPSAASVPSALPATQERVSDSNSEAGIRCGPQAALYQAENGSNVWITRKGRIGQSDPLRPLSGQASELVLQASIEGRVVTAYGPSFARLVRGGSVQELESKRGEPIAWDPQVNGLPQELQTVSEDGSGAVTGLKFRQCGTPPSAGREAKRRVTAEPPKAASAPGPGPISAAEGGGLEVPRALSLPQGALPEHGLDARALSAPSALPQPSASSAQPVTERMAPDAQHDWRLDGGISQASDAKLVNINTAAVEELNRLGGRFARAIVAGRPYASIDELVSKRVLTRSTFSQIKDRITAN
jgi:hypothetical protein